MSRKKLGAHDETLSLPMDSRAHGGERSEFIEGASTKAERQELFLPITGFVWFYPEEIAIIDHPAFQRLSRINQLGQAHYAFRGATHKRIEHVLGVVHIAQKMVSSVNFNVEKSKANGRKSICAPLSEREQRFIRLGALLHDIGHIAAGHTLEDELEIVGKHDADARLDLIFDKHDWDSAPGIPVEPLKTLINHHFEKYVPPALAAEGMTAADIVRLLIRKIPASADQDKYAAHQGKITKSAEIRFSVCTNMIANTICADLLDYLYRDWYHVGKPRTPDDRIFQYMEIHRLQANGNSVAVSTKRHVDDRFVIALGQKTRIRSDGVSAILGFLEWRYDLAEMVLFHRTKLAASAMLDRALFELWERKSHELENLVLPLSDEQLIDAAIKEADQLREQAGKKDDPKLVASSSLLRKLRDRNLFEELATFDSTNLAEPRILEIRRDYAETRAGGKTGAQHRAQTARVLEADFKLPPGSVAIYCSHIRPKIAEVTIAVDDEVMKFNEYEAKYHNRLSGGHLQAQIERFERLWRIYFFIDAEVKKDLPKEKLLLLQQTVEQIVLEASGDQSRLIQRVKEKAMHLVHQEKERGNNGIEFVDQLITAAKSDPESALRVYPNGAPSIRSFIRQR